ncbi:MAG: phytanoyl-CoA dioxygenase family protein [Armatimonadota bacterium]|nr:phytanoyl-CoA dioxygenase family protein [Armatimonadota bacterium]
MSLSPEQKAQYEREGFLAVREVLTVEEVQAIRDTLSTYLRAGLDMLRRGEVPESDSVTYQGVSIQLEPAVLSGKVRVEDPAFAARKIWNLYGNDELVTRLVQDERILSLVTSVLGDEVWFFADKALLKPPHIGVEKPWHQDIPYFPFEPKAPYLHVAVWIALDDATAENGCMQYISGSHLWGNLTTETTWTESVSHLAVDEARIDLSQAVLVEAKAGDIVLHDGMVLHYSAPNRSPYPRWAMILDFISVRARYTGEGQPPFPRLRYAR